MVTNANISPKMGNPIDLAENAEEEDEHQNVEFSNVYCIEGSRPECCISSMICSRDTPFWLETLDILIFSFNQTASRMSEYMQMFKFFFYTVSKTEIK